MSMKSCEICGTKTTTNRTGSLVVHLETGEAECRKIARAKADKAMAKAKTAARTRAA